MGYGIAVKAIGNMLGELVRRNTCMDLWTNTGERNTCMDLWTNTGERNTWPFVMKVIGDLHNKITGRWGGGMRRNNNDSPARRTRKFVMFETACDPSAFDVAAPRPKLVTLAFGLAEPLSTTAVTFDSSFERVCHCSQLFFLSLLACVLVSFSFGAFWKACQTLPFLCASIC